jgi:hypothetical protein
MVAGHHSFAAVPQAETEQAWQSWLTQLYA